jgi:hypothetical protein
MEQGRGVSANPVGVSHALFLQQLCLSALAASSSQREVAVRSVRLVHMTRRSVLIHACSFDLLFGSEDVLSTNQRLCLHLRRPHEVAQFPLSANQSGKCFGHRMRAQADA